VEGFRFNVSAEAFAHGGQDFLRKHMVPTYPVSRSAVEWTRSAGLQRFPVEWNRRAISISPLSSPAKAGDPVTPGAAEYWIPRFRGE
jgi:hypothetical protein